MLEGTAHLYYPILFKISFNFDSTVALAVGSIFYLKTFNYEFILQSGFFGIFIDFT